MGFMEHVRFDLAVGWWWFYAIVVVASAILAYVVYNKTTPPVDRRSRTFLILLRTVGISCLCLMLFEPLLRFVKSETSTPKIAIAIDVSRSMALRDNSGDRSAIARRVVEQLRNALGDRADIFRFDEKLRQDTANESDTLTFAGFRTDIAHAINGIANYGVTGKYGAVLLITDGNHNGDDVPVHVAERSGLGIYSIGIGDTVPPKDILAAGMLINGIAIVGQAVPVTIMINSTNVGDQDVEVILEDNGLEIARERVSVRHDVGEQSVTLRWVPISDGIRKVSARLTSIEGEFTTRNNVVQEFVAVRKDKRRVVLFAGAPSADVTFIKTALVSDPSVTVSTFIQKQGAEYYEGAIPRNAFDNVEAVFLVGWPVQSTSQDVIERVALACSKGTSLLFIPSVQTDYGKLAPFQGILPFSVGTSRPQEYLVTPDVARGATADPILKLTGTDSDVETWNNLPPIYRTETFVDPRPGSVVLASVRVGNTSLDDPLIIKREDGNHRSLAILGYGIFRWKLLGDGPSASRGKPAIDVLQSFIGNSLRWLSVRDDQRRVRIRSSHPFYAAGESIGFGASVQDQTFAPVDDAEVVVGLEGPSGKQELFLNGLGSGRYAFTVGPLPPGDYFYSGSATSNGLQVGSDRGRFTVGDLDIEDGASTRNVSLLHTLAYRTGAITKSHDEVNAVLKAIVADPRLRSVAYSKERELPLYHLPWIIAIAIVAFSGEWFLRKRRGLI